MAREFENPGWTRNLIHASRLRSGERVLVVVDEPLVEQGSQLVAAAGDAGAAPRLELWAGARPLAHAPPEVLAGAREADVAYFLAQKPLGAEASARFELGETIESRGGRMLFLGFVDAELLAGELSQPPVDVSE